jgi:hypothetical protein
MTHIPVLSHANAPALNRRMGAVDAAPKQTRLTPPAAFIEASPSSLILSAGTTTIPFAGNR